jgi:hypothetical protein
MNTITVQDQQSLPDTKAAKWYLRHVLWVVLLLAITAGLAITSLWNDSITYDETSHLTSGASYLLTHDFRLAPDHPPLAKLWCALPTLFMDQRWPGPDTPGWHDASIWYFGLEWLSDLNDGERLVRAGRLMMIPLLLATCLLTYAAARMIFGPPTALLALILACLSSTMLAHGRLVTTDMPVTLFFLLTLVTFARALEHLTWLRVLIASASLAGLAVVKFSWPLILPAIGIMAIFAVFRPEPLRSKLLPGRRKAGRRLTWPSRELKRRRERLAAIAAAGAFTIVFAWLGIWTCYGWHYAMARAPENAPQTMVASPSPWGSIFKDDWGRPITGPSTWLISRAREHQLLPEAYLFGTAYTFKSTVLRASYLMGEYSTQGWRSYFPIAFGVKTELAIMLLLVAGVLALRTRFKPALRSQLLAIGLAAFVGAYVLSAINTHINIGHRHLLPLYPAVFILAGTSVAWLRWRVGQIAIVVAISWLLAANLHAHPHYLSYFNELAGGPANGHKYLADSNIDWGQDLKRLAAWSHSRPDEVIKLSYFGSVDPSRYGIKCEMLLSSFPFNERRPFAPAATLTPGTYVVSTTQLLGVYEPVARDEFWRDRTSLLLYQDAERQLATPLPAGASAEERKTRELTLASCKRTRCGKLLNALQHRPPDDRIGWSLWVFRLTQAELDTIFVPPRPTD